MWEWRRRGEGGKQKKKVKETLEETTGPVGKEGSLPWQPWLWGKGKRSESRWLKPTQRRMPFSPVAPPPTHLMFTEHLLGDGPCGFSQSLAGGGDRPVNRRHVQFLLKTPCGQVWASASFPCSLVLAWLQLPCLCSALRGSPPPPTSRAPAPFGSLAPQLHSLS